MFEVILIWYRHVVILTCTLNFCNALSARHWGTLYNYGPLCMETSRFVNLRGKQPPED